MNDIFKAIEENNVDLLKEALISQEDVNEANDVGETPLIVLARKSRFHPEMLDLLLAQTTLQVNKTDGFNNSALIAGIVAKNTKFIELFLLRKVGEIDFHIQSYDCGTALTYAIFSCQDRIAVQLLSHERSFTTSEHPTAVNWAVLNGDRSMLELLVRKGADVNQPGFVGHHTIPEWAVRELLCDPDAPMSRREVFTIPVCCAILTDKMDMLELLIDVYKADVNQVTVDGNHPLVLAARQPNAIRLMVYLLSRGASLAQEIRGVSIFTLIQQDVSVSHETKIWLENFASLQKTEANFIFILCDLLGLNGLSVSDSRSHLALMQRGDALIRIIEPLCGFEKRHDKCDDEAYIRNMLSIGSSK